MQQILYNNWNVCGLPKVKAFVVLPNLRQSSVWSGLGRKGQDMNSPEATTLSIKKCHRPNSCRLFAKVTSANTWPARADSSTRHWAHTSPLTSQPPTKQTPRTMPLNLCIAVDLLGSKWLLCECECGCRHKCVCVCVSTLVDLLWFCRPFCGTPIQYVLRRVCLCAVVTIWSWPKRCGAGLLIVANYV